MSGSLLRHIPHPGSGEERPRRGRLLLAAATASLAVLTAPAATAVLAEPIEGEWEGAARVYRVESIGPQQFRGVIVESNDACFPPGDVQWQIRGSGTAYTGTTQWKFTGSCRPSGLGQTVWTVTGDTLRDQSTNPTNPSEVRVRIFKRRGGTGPVTVGDPGSPEPPRSTPVATANPADRGLVARTATAVTGTGTIVQVPQRALASGAATQGLACGFNRYRCYTQLTPGTRVVLRARPQPGHVFRGWTGACAGRSATCVLVARDLQTVTALFAPRSPAATVGLEVNRPRVRVGWKRSVGSGSVTVSGRVGGPARLRLQVRRPGGGPLLTRRLSLRGGAFRQPLPLKRGALARGALVFPGGLVVSVNGSSGSSPLALHVRTLVVPAPREGVVRRAFASAIENGPPTVRLPATVKEAWARFQFVTQPSTRLPLTVAWYQPNGRLLGVAAKSNRPAVASSIRSSAPIPRGTWVAELRAGARIVKRLSVRIG